MLPLFLTNDIALAVGGDKVWFAKGKDGQVVVCPAYVTTSAGKVLAVGEEALRMQGKEPGNIQVTRITKQGGFVEGALAAAFLRYLIRSNLGFRGFGIAPRAIVACADAAKMGVKSAAIQAGVRELLTINPVMAAAIGAGLAVEEPEFKNVLVLERDWCSFGVISLAGMVASFDLVGGIELLLEDFALHVLATRSVALDLDSMHASFLKRGLSGAELLGWDAWIGELETGRAAVVAADDTDLRRGSLPFILRLGWRYQRAMELAAKAKRRDAAVASLCLAGSYSRVPGITDLVAKAFHCRVVVPEHPEEAMVRGCQRVLADLKFLLPHFGSKP